MAKTDKVTAVAEISDRFRESSATVLTEYRGLTTAQLNELRRSLGRETTYAVVKNTLAKRAAAEAGYRRTRASCSPGRPRSRSSRATPVEAAKGLRDFARTNPLLVIKGAVFEGRALSADEVRQIADLESREVLLARLAGAMKAKPEQGRGAVPGAARAASPGWPPRFTTSGRTGWPRGGPAERLSRPRPRRLTATSSADCRRPAVPAGRGPSPPGQTRKDTPPWRSSAPRSCSRRSRR